MSLVYFSSDRIGLPVLEWLAKNTEPGRLLVVTAPDARVGRGKQWQGNPIKVAAEAMGVAVLQPREPNEELIPVIEEMGATRGFVFAYGHLLKAGLLKCFRGNLLNFHGSILPKYRGASPVETAIVAGDLETGVSLMQVVRRMDAGPVAAVERVGIGPRTTGPGLREELAEAAVRCLERTWASFLAGRLSFVAQDEGRASYVRRLTKEDGALDFRLGAAELERRVRAFQGWPGSWFEVERGSAGEVERWRTDAVAVGPQGSFGKVGAVTGRSENGLMVQAGDGLLLIERLQRPGGKMMDAGSFLRGMALAEGMPLLAPAGEPLVRYPTGEAWG
ncbi:MAG: methionyl-tRNA formyltransferase [Puniceicoccaceae bacterium]